MKKLTALQMQSLGGRARWRGTTPKQRSEAMKKVAHAKKLKVVSETPGEYKVEINK
jgi:hypothetical protein